MSSYAKAVAILTEALPGAKGRPYPVAARYLMDALTEKRLHVVAMRGSPDMLRRFHAHARFLGRETGYGYRDIYNDALDYAMEHDEWPVREIVRHIEVSGEIIAIDVQIPESTTRANNKQLMRAYEYVQDCAQEHGITLPENWEAIDE